MSIVAVALGALGGTLDDANFRSAEETLSSVICTPQPLKDLKM